MGDFDKAVAWVLKHEGGFVNDPDDPGKATNRGITLKTLTKWRRKPCTAEDVERMTEQEARDIYRALYWQFDEVNDDRVATKLMDLSVLFGPPRAVMFAQEAALSLGQPVKVDGKWGPITRGAVNRCYGGDFMLSLRQEAQRFIEVLVRAKIKMKKYQNGWEIRLRDWPV